MSLISNFICIYRVLYKIKLMTFVIFQRYVNAKDLEHNYGLGSNK